MKKNKNDIFLEDYFYGNKQRLKFGVAKLPNAFIRLSFRTIVVCFAYHSSSKTIRIFSLTISAKSAGRFPIFLISLLLSIARS